MNFNDIWNDVHGEDAAMEKSFDWVEKDPSNKDCAFCLFNENNECTWNNNIFQRLNDSEICHHFEKFVLRGDY
jgi:hypothetical protein